MFFAVRRTLLAFLAFYITHLIENSVNNYKAHFSRKKLLTYGAGIGLAFFVLAIVTVTPSKDKIVQNRIANEKRQQKSVFKEGSADQLAFEIVNHHYQINVIDVRPVEEYNKYHIPMAINIPFEELNNRRWKSIFNQKIKTNYFYADSDTLAKKSCLWAKYIGKSENFILHETSKEFKQLFSDQINEPQNATKAEMNIYHYRLKLQQEMNALVEVFKNLSQPVKVKEVKIKGGCS